MDIQSRKEALKTLLLQISLHSFMYAHPKKNNKMMMKKKKEKNKKKINLIAATQCHAHI